MITSADAKSCALIAPDYEFGHDELLLFCPRPATNFEYTAALVRLLIPKLLQKNSLHHYHTSLEGCHQEKV